MKLVDKQWANPKEIYSRLNKLKRINPDFKIILAIGGWTDSQGSKYSNMVSNPTKRQQFVSNTVQFLRENKFDGLDFDWEYPVCWQSDCNAGPASDKENFAKLLQVRDY
jgi:chitinase